MTIHRSQPIVLTGDSHGRMDQWFVLQKASTPIEKQEEIQRANDQDLELDWMKHDSERSPKIITEHHPVCSRFSSHL